MWWFNKKMGNDDELRVFSQLKSAFDSMHKQVLSEKNDLSKEQLNIVEKKLYLDLVNEMMQKYSKIVTKSELKMIRHNILEFLEKCWIEVEPDKVISLLK